MMSENDDGHLQSVVFFLSDTLSSAIAEGTYLRQIQCAPPEIGTRTSAREIASRLSDFRRRVNALRRHEVLLVTKLLRARELVVSLRTLDPELKPEIDMFRLSTVCCSELLQLLLPDAEQLFHGGDHPRRFLGMRLLKPRTAGDYQPPTAAGDYLVAGKVAVLELIRACEVLNARLIAKYEPVELSLIGEEVIEDDDAPAPPPADEAEDDALLLSDIDEVVVEGSATPQQVWQTYFTSMN